MPQFPLVLVELWVFMVTEVHRGGLGGALVVLITDVPASPVLGACADKSCPFP